MLFRGANGDERQVWKPRWHCGLTLGEEWDVVMDISGRVPGKRPVNPTSAQRAGNAGGSTQGLGSLYYNYYFFNYRDCCE